MHVARSSGPGCALLGGAAHPRRAAVAARHRRVPGRAAGRSTAPACSPRSLIGLVHHRRSAPGAGAWSPAGWACGSRCPGAVADYYKALFLNAALPGGVLGDVDRAVEHGRDRATSGAACAPSCWNAPAGQIVLVGVGLVVLLTVPSPVLSPSGTARSAAGPRDRGRRVRRRARGFVVWGRAAPRHVPVASAARTGAAEIRTGLLSRRTGRASCWPRRWSWPVTCPRSWWPPAPPARPPRCSAGAADAAGPARDEPAGEHRRVGTSRGRHGAGLRGGWSQRHAGRDIAVAHGSVAFRRRRRPARRARFPRDHHGRTSKTLGRARERCW